MIGVLIRRELLGYARNRRFLWAFWVVVLLVASASVDGWSRAREATEARQSAEVGDRDVWVRQGENSPHGAAHFARYAFRPTPVLAAFEPGVFDYAGAAIWMEAHNQNPATLRRAEDAVSRASLPALSPGWVLRVIGTFALLVLLYPAVAGEREHGTLRSISAAGVDGRAFVVGKVVAAVTAVLGLTVVSMGVSLTPLALAGPTGPGMVRLVMLFAVYAIGLTTFGLVVLALSAKSRTAGSAMMGGTAYWLTCTLVVPVVAAQLATTLHPDIDEQAFKSSLQLQAQTPFWVGEAGPPAIAAYEKAVTEQYGAPDFESLGFSREGMELQAHEVFANGVFDRLYGELFATHEAQDATLRWAALASPLFAVERLSAGLAGTDLLAQRAFAAQAELHRRATIERLNRDMMENAGSRGFSYTAGEDLWSQIPDFVGQQPTTSDVRVYYRAEWASLLVWLTLASLLAVRWTSRAMEGEDVA